MMLRVKHGPPQPSSHSRTQGRNQTRPLLGSMFVRRLLVLAGLSTIIIAALGAQLTRLTVFEGEDHRDTAERRLDRVKFLPTYRGRILDRHGRVLAEDRAGYDIAFEYEFLSGAWAARRATQEARASVGPSRWGELSAAEREALIGAALPAAEAQAQWLLDVVARLIDVDGAELDHRVDEIKKRVHARAVSVWDRQREIERSRHADGEERFTPRSIQEHREAHGVAQGVPDVVAFECQRLADEYPGTVEVEEATRRVYPASRLEVELDRSRLPRTIRKTTSVKFVIDGVADHVLGELREKVWPSDLKARPFLDASTGKVVDLGGYRPGIDRVGARGIEASQERLLRGVRGMEQTRLDTGQVLRTEPQPGQDVALTIDIELQAMVHAILTPRFGLMKVQPWQVPNESEESERFAAIGSELYGAAVVIEVDTGEILAAVSMPTVFHGREMDGPQIAASHPFVNRPFEAPYPPGSILKPVIYLGAVSAGVMRRDVRIECNGHYLPNDPTRLRCWIYRERTGFSTHSARIGGPLDVVEAIARSCNIFFYSAATRLGGTRLVAWLGQFGIGTPLDCGLLATIPDENDRMQTVGEHGGFLPSEPGTLAMNEVAQMGIGQGPVAWTPVQAANAFATIARGGVTRDATLIRAVGSGARGGEAASQSTEHAFERAGPRPDLPLDPAAVSLALQGLRDSVNSDHGTGGRLRYENNESDPIIDTENLLVWGKTGTVQAPPGPDHAWFVGLVSPATEGRPRYAVAVIVEGGRSGGRGAGPVCNQIIHAMRRLGYLPNMNTAAPPARSDSAAKDRDE